MDGKLDIRLLTVTDSNTVEAMGYDIVHSHLWVRFKGGATYRYANVDPKLWGMVAGAKSVGAWIWANLRPFPRLHPYIRVDREGKEWKPDGEHKSE